MVRVGLGSERVGKFARGFEAFCGGRGVVGALGLGAAGF
jgi:hypothetical protein